MQRQLRTIKKKQQRPRSPAATVRSLFISQGQGVLQCSVCATTRKTSNDKTGMMRQTDTNQPTTHHHHHQRYVVGGWVKSKNHRKANKHARKQVNTPDRGPTENQKTRPDQARPGQTRPDQKPRTDRPTNQPTNQDQPTRPAQHRNNIRTTQQHPL